MPALDALSIPSGTSNPSSQKPLLLGIEHIQLNVHSTPETLEKDLVRVRQFYINALNLVELPPTPSILPPKPTQPSHLAILWFAFPTNLQQHIHVVLKSDSPEGTIYGSELERLGRGTRAHPGLVVAGGEEGVKEVRERFLREGCEGVEDVKYFEPSEGAKGRWRFHGRDLWGNTFEFLAWDD
ncbi:hypothetical protein HK097_010791 [Rhizophlyctis rosea]|uniref:Uncharacterized protein n=1 Tax=Rhizophlyctis rosea TaxID=64517 RepID=A0AAD5S776_9FUNG|nr:hypothetical protein HK097_010791 [Rhizophlyctis rosea]